MSDGHTTFLRKHLEGLKIFMVHIYDMKKSMLIMEEETENKIEKQSLMMLVDIELGEEY